MPFIDPKDAKSYDRDPEEGNFPSGVYLCELSRVQEIDPSAKFPNANRRLVFEFTLADPAYPQYAGKKAAAIVGKTLLRSKEGRESKLVQLARMMGVGSPEKGFDPDTLIEKKYQVMTEFTDGRSWARQAVPAPPSAQQQPQHAPAADLRVAAGKNALLSAGTEAELKAAWERLDGDVQRQLVPVLAAQKAACIAAAAPEPKTDPNYGRIPF